MKGEDVKDEVTSTASTTLGKEEKTRMKNGVKAIASLHSIYDVDFQNLMREQKLRAREELSKRMDLVLTDPL